VERCEAIASELPSASAAARAAILALAPDASSHAGVEAELAALRAVELAPPPPGAADAPREVRVVAWNAQRGGAPAAAAARLRGAQTQVLLLSELDVGMARSGQRHAARALAAELGMGFAFGVEFLELGLGDAEERRRWAGHENEVGYHGGAIASSLPLERPTLVRLDAGGDWFDGRRGERRVGGRIALLATIRIACSPIVFASVHLESHGDPALRDAQAAALLDALEAYAPGAPALVGGDVNTHSLGSAELEDRAALQRALLADPRRFADPIRHEPLFARFERAGFDWRACNLVAEPTHRQRRGSERGGLHLDWFFARGLAVSAPAVIEATDPATGAPLSDHELIAVTVRGGAG
jgi:endonuclease/exonuclease/phosphatase family metal-dependent hydrolase